MTVIAYKEGIIAADSASFSGNSIATLNVRKVERSPNGILGGATGASTFCESFRAWIRAECMGKPSVPDDDFGMVIRPGSKFIEIWDKHGVAYFEQSSHAIGAGDDFAIGAMAAGASAIEAVKIAIKHCAFAAGKVQHLKR